MSRARASTGLRGTILALSVGQVGTLIHGEREVPSGFRKTPTEVVLELGPTGLDGDQQADLVFHGGPEKAVCVYPFEHYRLWEAELGITLEIPAFGENLTTQGLVESEVCLGDIFRWGGATVQVSQPRRPCYKIAARYEIKDLAVRVEDSLRTGFYLRVLQPGRVSMTDQLVLSDVDPAGISVQDVSHAMNGRRSALSPEDRNALWDKVLRSQHLLPKRWVPILQKFRNGAPGDPQHDDAARLGGTTGGGTTGSGVASGGTTSGETTSGGAAVGESESETEAARAGVRHNSIDD